MAEERTGKLSFGNTVDPTGRWCLISGLGVKGKVPNGSLEILKESSKATATVPMTEWAAQESCMLAVGDERQAVDVAASFIQHSESVQRHSIFRRTSAQCALR